MKKIIVSSLLLIFTLTLIIKPTHAVDIDILDIILLEPSVVANEIVIGQTQQTYKQAIISYFGSTDKHITLIMPNNILATVFADGDYYYDVNVITITIFGDNVIMSLYTVNMVFLDEIYYSILSFSYDIISLIPTESSFDTGYKAGRKDGEQDGFDNGYDVAKRIFGIEIQGQWLTAVEYATQQVTTAIQNTIAEWGINIDGIDYTAAQWGDMRYQAGLAADSNKTALGVMFNGLAAIFGVGLAFILQLGSIELMGISLNMILGIGLLLVGLIAILGLVFGGGK